MRPGPDMTTSLVAGDISLRQKRKDAVTPQEVRDYKLTGCPSCGACTFLGTASTMQCMAEALGLTLPGAALMPATMRDILGSARMAGRKIMELIDRGIKVSDIVTREALENAVIIHSAIGGSTNATIHLPAIAHEAGVELELPKKTPPAKRKCEDRTVLVLVSDNKAALHKRPEKGLLAGLYELPNLLGHLSREEVLAFVKEQGLSPIRIRELPAAKHVFSHIEWHMAGYAVKVEEPQEEGGARDSLFFVDREEMEKTYSIPSAFGAYTGYFRERY